MTRTALVTLAVLASVAGCAPSPATPAGSRSATPAPAAGPGGEEGTAFFVGDLSWTTSTSSTWAMPAPAY